MHGRLSADEKDAVMAAFRAGEIDVLVCTTVIEVGVDVPNATVMFVMDADRFGISQLHQLRGRIGRGEHASLCLLATRLPEESKAGERLKAVAGTLDGFELADLDLKERREGDVLGYSQSGRPITLRFLSLFEHREVIEAASEFCERVLPAGPRRSRNGSSGSAIHRHRPRRVPGQDMSRKRLTWLAVAVALADRGRLSDGGVGGQRAASFIAQAEVPTVAPVSTCWPGWPRCRCASAASTTAERRSVTRGPTTTRRPGGHNGCDTRNDILERDLVDKTYVSIKRCPNAVATGTLHDPYTNATVAFVRGNQIGASVQIDHIVPLALAWDLGARDWTDDMRLRFANDPANLLAVAGQANQDKGDSEPALVDAAQRRVPVPVRRAVHRGAARLRASRRCAVGGGAAGSRRDLPDALSTSCKPKCRYRFRGPAGTACRRRAR